MRRLNPHLRKKCAVFEPYHFCLLGGFRKREKIWYDFTDIPPPEIPRTCVEVHWSSSNSESERSNVHAGCLLRQGFQPDLHFLSVHLFISERSSSEARAVLHP
jgi:hypothetical protein